MKSKPTRRSFVRNSSATVLGAPFLLSGSHANASNVALPPIPKPKLVQDVSLRDRIYKTLKIGMVRIKASLTDKFQAAKEAGFEINYYGWAAAEVGGGDLDRLKEVSGNMDQVFNLV